MGNFSILKIETLFPSLFIYFFPIFAHPQIQISVCLGEKWGCTPPPPNYTITAVGQAVGREAWQYYPFSSLGLNSSPLFLGNQSSTPLSVQNPSSTMISTVNQFIQALVQESSDTGMHNAFTLLLMINNLKLLVIRADLRS